jgi:hypothetical protein
VLSGPAYRDGPQGGAGSATKRLFGTGNPSHCGDLGVARGTRANDRNSLSRDQATPHHIEIAPNIEKVPGPNRCRLHVNGLGLALAITHGAANRPPQIALISIETGYRNGAIRTERHKHCF